LEQADESAFVELIPLLCNGDITPLLFNRRYASKVGQVRRSSARHPAFLCASSIPLTDAHEWVLNVQVEFQDGQQDEMVWVQLIAFLREPARSAEKENEARRAKNHRLRERAREEPETAVRLKAKRARYLVNRKERLQRAREEPTENEEVLEKEREKKRAKRARKRERKRQEAPELPN
jgi:hypothetical protein